MSTIDSKEYATILDDIISSAQNWASEDADQPTAWCDEWKKVYPLLAAAPTLLTALVHLREELRSVLKFDVKKHYHLMVADVAADNAIRKARGVQS